MGFYHSSCVIYPFYIFHPAILFIFEFSSIFIPESFLSLIRICSQTVYATFSIFHCSEKQVAMILYMRYFDFIAVVCINALLAFIYTAQPVWLFRIIYPHYDRAVRRQEHYAKYEVLFIT